MASSDKPTEPQASSIRPPPAAKGPVKNNQADFYDTQFIVGRLKDDQRKSRFRFYMAVAVLAIVIVALYTLTARRAEAPKSLKTDPVVVPAPVKQMPPFAPAKGKHAPKPEHR